MFSRQLEKQMKTGTVYYSVRICRIQGMQGILNDRHWDPSYRIQAPCQMEMTSLPFAPRSLLDTEWKRNLSTSEMYSCGVLGNSGGSRGCANLSKVVNLQWPLHQQK